jgi:hypothetical protein
VISLRELPGSQMFHWKGFTTSSHRNKACAKCAERGIFVTLVKSKNGRKSMWKAANEMLLLLNKILTFLSIMAFGEF